ncbi:MAG: hypothetical protein JKY70_17555 [Mucilaginibacter sp.]|nr:hypothetical protein [Mucilaginibacter sp.]
MKNLIGAFCLLCCLAITACSSNSNENAADSSAAHPDRVSPADSTTAAAKGASSSSAIGGFDTSRAKLDTANTNSKK